MIHAMGFKSDELLRAKLLGATLPPAGWTRIRVEVDFGRFRVGDQVLGLVDGRGRLAVVRVLP
jgi:hypothetical protein